MNVREHYIMKDTPTPRTDALRTKLHENINTPNIVKYMETVLHANTLETELTAALEEINILKSKYADHYTEAERITSEIKTVTKQRDEWKAKFIQQNKDLGCEMMDPNGTIWDYAKKLQNELPVVTEQRDRLAEALRQLATQAPQPMPSPSSKRAPTPHWPW